MGYKDYQKEWKQLYEDGLSLTEIGKRYGTSKGIVKNVLKEVVTFRPQSPYEQYHDTWYDLYVNQGYSKQDIAIKYGTQASTVSNALRKKGILPKRQEKKRKYDDLLPFFIQEYKEGKSLNEIADKYEVEMVIVRSYLLNEGIKLRTITEATRQYPINETYFQTLDNDEKAFHLGVVFGKGSLHQNSFSSYLDVSIHQKRKHLLSSLVRAIQPDNQARQIRENVLHRFISSPLYESLCHYGFKEEKIKYIPENRVVPFCKGYLSVKLYVSPKKAWRIRDKKEILETLGLWFSTVIPSSAIYLREEEGYYFLHIYQQDMIQRLKDWLSVD